MRFQLSSIRFQLEYDLADLLLCDKMKENETWGAISNLRKNIIRLKFAREKIYEKPHLCRKTSEKNNIGELGSTRA